VNPYVDKAILQLFCQGPSPSLLSGGWAKGVDLHQNFTNSRLVLGLGLASPCGSSRRRLLGGPEMARALRVGVQNDPNIILLCCRTGAGAATQPSNAWPALPGGFVARERLPRERKRQPTLAQALPHLSLVPIRARRVDPSPCMRQVKLASCTLPPLIDGPAPVFRRKLNPEHQGPPHRNFGCKAATRIRREFDAAIKAVRDCTCSISRWTAAGTTPHPIQTPPFPQDRGSCNAPERRDAARCPKITKKSSAPEHHATERKTYSLSAGSPCLCPPLF
jgi:hypothetical protein